MRILKVQVNGPLPKTGGSKPEYLEKTPREPAPKPVPHIITGKNSPHRQGIEPSPSDPGDN